MAVKNVIFVVLFVVSVAVCLPRDSTAVHADNDIVQQAELHYSNKVEISTLATSEVHQPELQISNEAESSTQAASEVPAVHIPGRISCSHEEATEDVICLEHCLPKGYSYGLCVSRTCSCI